MSDIMDSIDWKLCLKLNNNRPELAKELLTLFAKELPETKNNIKQAWQQQAFTPLKDEVHKLHGACCYCGVPRLKEIVEKLENLLKTDINNPEIASLITQLDQEIDNVMETLSQPNFFDQQ